MKRTTVALMMSVTVLVFSPLAGTQESTQSKAPKDSTALAVLTQVAAVTGWNRLNAVADVVAAGTVTYDRGERQELFAVTLKNRGGDKVRAELQEGSFKRTIIINGARAAALTRQGTRSIPSSAAASLRLQVLPFLTDLVSANEDNVAVFYHGTEDVGGELCHKIEIVKNSTAVGLPEEVHRRIAGLTVWVSITTGLPVQVQYPRISSSNSTAALPVIRYLSNYRLVEGIAVPFHQQEFVKGLPLYTLQLTNVELNAELSDSDFDVPGGLQ